MTFFCYSWLFMLQELINCFFILKNLHKNIISSYDSGELCSTTVQIKMDDWGCWVWTAIQIGTLLTFRAWMNQCLHVTSFLEVIINFWLLKKSNIVKDFAVYDLPLWWIQQIDTSGTKHFSIIFLKLPHPQRPVWAWDALDAVYK